MRIPTLLVALALTAFPSTAFSEEPKPGIQETGLDEIANIKPAGSKGAVSAEKFLRKLDAEGLKVRDRTEVLGKLVGAGLCIQASAGGSAFTVCEYVDAESAKKGGAKRKTIFGETNTEHSNGALTLTVSPSTDENVKKNQAAIAKAFGALGKPAGDKPAKDPKDPRDSKDR